MCKIARNVEKDYPLNQKVNLDLYSFKNCHKNVETCNKRNLILLTTQPRFTEAITLHYKVQTYFRIKVIIE